MRPFRKHVALSVDGGGIKGIIVTKALSILEDALRKPVHSIFRLTTGTSTGAIISAGAAAGLTARKIHELYVELGSSIFPQTIRSRFWPLARYRYSSTPLETVLRLYVGDMTIGDFWTADPPTDVVITTFDLVANRTRFIKPWKEEYKGWPVLKAVLASSSVPTYFPIVDGRYVDGGVGAYANPCYLAAYELLFCLGWDPAETTLISLGTGREPHTLQPGEANGYFSWQWLVPVLNAFLASADDQQVHLVDTFFRKLDFRRFQVDLREPIAMDDPAKIPELIKYGQELGYKILRDECDRAQEITPQKAPPGTGITL
jgi:hypothetical protein